MAIFRFVDPVTPATVRLNLRNRSGWYLGEGLDLGGKTSVRKFLRQDGVSGAELASAWQDVTQMVVPLILTPQATAAAMESLITQLNTELERLTNCIEYMPDGLSGTSWLIDTFQTDSISSQHGDRRPSQWLKLDGDLHVLQIDRQPTMRGRGTGI